MDKSHFAVCPRLLFYVPAIYTGTAANRPVELLSSGLCPSGEDYLIVKVQRAFADFLFLPCVILSLLSVGLLSSIPFSLATINRFQFLFTVCPSSQGRKKQFVKSDCYFLDLLFGIFCGKIGKSDFVNPFILFCPLGFFSCPLEHLYCTIK